MKDARNRNTRKQRRFPLPVEDRCQIKSCYCERLYRVVVIYPPSTITHVIEMCGEHLRDYDSPHRTVVTATSLGKSKKMRGYR